MGVLYAIGPLHFLIACEAFFANLWRVVGGLIATLAYQALDVVRAVAIALYVVFLVLAVLARRQGVRTGGTLVIVTLLFLLLVKTDWYDPGTKWVTAALLNAAGAAVMTSRLLRPPPPCPPEQTWSEWRSR